MVYDDAQLEGVASGLTEPMRHVLRGGPWPGMQTVKALRSRGLMTPTVRGRAVIEYIDRKASA